jgi:hypothetical protein
MSGRPMACADVAGQWLLVRWRWPVWMCLEAPSSMRLKMCFSMCWTLERGRPGRPTCWCGDADGPGRPMACVDAAGGSELDVEVLVGP